MIFRTVRFVQVGFDMDYEFELTGYKQFVSPIRIVHACASNYYMVY